MRSRKYVIDRPGCGELRDAPGPRVETSVRVRAGTTAGAPRDHHSVRFHQRDGDRSGIHVVAALIDERWALSNAAVRPGDQFEAVTTIEGSPTRRPPMCRPACVVYRGAAEA